MISRDVRFINEFENNQPCNNEITLIFHFSQNNENANVNTITHELEIFPSMSEPDSGNDIKKINSYEI